VSAEAAPRVLTVEADPIVRANLRLLLEDAGCSVCAEACDGAEGVELAQRYEPDAILLDLALPDLDGVEATRRIRTERDVPVVALTDHEHQSLIESAIEAGASSYVLAPFGKEAVVAALVDAFDIQAEAALDTARRASLRMVTDVIRSLRLPKEWAVEVEWRCYRAGKVWTRLP
jgi:DNA-binding NarL/FixJ family response regulator